MHLASYNYDTRSRVLTLVTTVECYFHEVAGIVADAMEGREPALAEVVIERDAKAETALVEVMVEPEPEPVVEKLEPPKVEVVQTTLIPPTGPGSGKDVPVPAVVAEALAGDYPPAPEKFEGHVIVSRRKGKTGSDVLTLFSGDEVMLAEDGTVAKRRKLSLADSSTANWEHANRWKAGMAWGDCTVAAVTVISERRTDLILDDGRTLMVGPDDTFKVFVHEQKAEPEPEPEPVVETAEEKPGMDPTKALEAYEAQEQAEEAAPSDEDPNLTAVKGCKTVQDVVRGLVERIGPDFDAVLAFCRGHKCMIPRLDKLADAKFEAAIRRAFTAVSG